MARGNNIAKTTASLNSRLLPIATFSIEPFIARSYVIYPVKTIAESLSKRQSVTGRPVVQEWDVSRSILNTCSSANQGFSGKSTEPPELPPVLHSTVRPTIIPYWPTRMSERMIFAGLPPTNDRSGTSVVTTEPAATMHRSPIRTPGRIIDPAPMKQ